jgi:hypothetical protein
MTLSFDQAFWGQLLDGWTDIALVLKYVAEGLLEQFRPLVEKFSNTIKIVYKKLQES